MNGGAPLRRRFVAYVPLEIAQIIGDVDVIGHRIIFLHQFPELLAPCRRGPSRML